MGINSGLAGGFVVVIAVALLLAALV